MINMIQTCSAVPIYTEHRGIIDISKRWYNGKVISISFLDGSEKLQSKVLDIASIWTRYANLSFERIHRFGDIRITFKSGGSWSYIGTDSIGLSKLEPTMQLGWLTEDTPIDDYKRVVLHEFGHAIGLLHEHQNPNGGIKWNIPKVMEYYRSSQGWSDEYIITNVLSLAPNSNYLIDKFDEKSIMLYPVSSELTLDGYSTTWNSDLSQGDVQLIQKMYPK